MFSVTREITFCYGHRLLDYNGKCKYLHGHNGRAVITLETDDLDRLGMVVDFSVLKRVVGGWIDESLDHRMILHKDDPVLPTLRAQGEPVHVVDFNPHSREHRSDDLRVHRLQGLPGRRGQAVGDR
jgi:6-pyruvoyltetrahydropterin/6-carboxytetrahydropterin synthase